MPVERNGEIQHLDYSIALNCGMIGFDLEENNPNQFDDFSIDELENILHKIDSIKADIAKSIKDR